MTDGASTSTATTATLTGSDACSYAEHMGDPACHLASVCLSCGRFLEEVELAECPHCGHSLSEDALSPDPEDHRTSAR